MRRACQGAVHVSCHAAGPLVLSGLVMGNQASVKENKKEKKKKAKKRR
jgi:hypothetical protein